MKSLALSARRAKEDTGGFLPPVFSPFEAAKIRLRTGTATMIAGPPGAMKTGITLYWLLRLNLPTLYFSADAEDFEMVERAAAAISGDSVEKVRANPGAYADILAEHAGNVKLIYDDAPTYDVIELELAAYAEVHGRFPTIVAVDNLMNVTGEQENEWASMRDSARVIHRVTRITKAAMLVLHHMADDRNDPSTPAPRAKLQGKVGQLPKLIISLAMVGNELRACPVKNRWGPADPTGQTYATVYVDAGRNRFYNSFQAMQMDQIA